jgi:hypothetical protein
MVIHKRGRLRTGTTSITTTPSTFASASRTTMVVQRSCPGVGYERVAIVAGEELEVLLPVGVTVTF